MQEKCAFAEESVNLAISDTLRLLELFVFFVIFT